ncbi:MAG: (Fe-S)-binding protein [Candidatus Thorarchaeota archaeon]
MSNVWTRARRNTPQIDCGLCGRPTCSSFARAYLADQLGLDDCPILRTPDFANLRVSLELMKRDNPLRPHAAPPAKSELVLFSPCAEDSSLISAEARVFNGVGEGQYVRFGGFDPGLLCDLLDATEPILTSVKCSRELGYARADYDESNVTILQDGRVNLRKLPSRAAAEDLFGRIERVILGATICDCCGCELLSIVVGECEKAGNTHPALHAGSASHVEYAEGEIHNIVVGTLNDQPVSAKDIIAQCQQIILTACDLLLNGEKVSEEPCDIEGIWRVVVRALAGAERETFPVLLRLAAMVWFARVACFSLSDLTLRVLALNRPEQRSILGFLADALRGKTPARTSLEGSVEYVMAIADVAGVARAIRLLST